MFSNITERLRRFMADRYGNDRLNIALLILGCVVTFILSIVSRFTHIWWLRTFSYIPFVFAVLRALSKNIYRRQQENESFTRWSEPFLALFRKKASQMQDTEHKYYDCPVCKKTLRVPAGRGKIEITCPHCGNKFKRRT